MIQEMQFPVFSTGMHPVDSAGRGIVLDDRANVAAAEEVVNIVKAMGQAAIFW